MKRPIITFFSLVIFISTTSSMSPFREVKHSETKTKKVNIANLTGSWKLTTPSDKGEHAIQIIADNYFTVAFFDKEGKKYFGTYGGKLSNTKGKIEENIEFDSWAPNNVGKISNTLYKVSKGKLHITRGGQTEIWEKLPEKSKSPLEGAWIITGRADHVGLMNVIQRGARKTVKVMAGNRFQWIAYNIDTKVISGTGGGIFGSSDTHYTETIEFFSKDPSRVNMSLTFNYRLEDKTWRHFGKSSTGNDIDEIWERD